MFHLFWSQKVKGQGHNTKAVHAWVFAVLWVLSFSVFAVLSWIHTHVHEPYLHAVNGVNNHLYSPIR